MFMPRSGFDTQRYQNNNTPNYKNSNVSPHPVSTTLPPTPIHALILLGLGFNGGAAPLVQMEVDHPGDAL